MVPSSLTPTQRPTVTPDPAALRQAADVLNAGRKVALLVGQGARGADAEIAEVVDLLGAGVAKALLGKDVLSDELPWVTGSIGLLGTRPSYEMMMGCDTLLTVGSNFPYTQFLPELDQARAVQIDIDGTMVGMRYPYEVNLVGDAQATLRALIPLLEKQQDRSWHDEICAKVADWWEVMDAEAHVAADPINPMRIFNEFSKVAPTTTRSSAPTAGRRRTGTPATSRCAAGCAARCPARSRRWARRCRTRSARSSPTPTGPRSRSRATARCR